MVRVVLAKRRTRSGKRRGKSFYILMVYGLPNVPNGWPIMQGRFTSYSRARARAKMLRRKYR